MALEEYLVEGETVLARAGNFYATQKRIIRYHKGLLFEELEDLDYHHIFSLPLLSTPMKRLIRLGAIVGALGAVGMLVRRFFEEVWPRVELPARPFLIALGLGALLILVGFLLRREYYQVRALGLMERDEARWRIVSRWHIWSVKKQETRRLVAQVREMWLKGTG